MLPVQFTLFARNGTQLHEVRRVLTHPHAAAQCRDWLADNLPRAIITEGGSTAAAAAEVTDPLSRFTLRSVHRSPASCTALCR